MVVMAATQDGADGHLRTAVSWCAAVGAAMAAAPEPSSTPSAAKSSEAPGYLAMLAFLGAYLLNEMELYQAIQTSLNLSGSVAGAIYLLRKHAIPSVISNVVWGAITVGGVMLG